MVNKVGHQFSPIRGGTLYIILTTIICMLSLSFHRLFSAPSFTRRYPSAQEQSYPNAMIKLYVIHSGYSILLQLDGVSRALSDRHGHPERPFPPCDQHYFGNPKGGGGVGWRLLPARHLDGWRLVFSATTIQLHQFHPLRCMHYLSQPAAHFPTLSCQPPALPNRPTGLFLRVSIAYTPAR